VSQRPGVMETIYHRPRDHDLEHEGDDDDVDFYTQLVERWRPRRIMELASGSGRITIPLVRLAASSELEVVGLEREGPMLHEARRKHAMLPESEQRRLSFVAGDMRDWRAPAPFDLIIAPCSALSHLLTLTDQVAAWRCAFEKREAGRPLRRGPDDAEFGSLRRVDANATADFLEIDIDAHDPRTGIRLLRYKTTRYLAHEQRAEIRFLYDKFPSDDHVDRYVSDFDCHVNYPREVELLFRLTGFSVDARFGD